MVSKSAGDGTVKLKRSVAVRPQGLYFPALNWLDRARGRLDNHTDVLELVLRDAVAQASQHSGGPRAYLAELKKKHAPIDANYSPPGELSANVARWSIVQTTVLARTFFKRLARDYQRFRKPPNWEVTWKKHPTPTPLQILLHNLSAPAIAKSLNVELVEYYWAVRNWLIHESDDVSLAWDAVVARSDEFAVQFPGMVAPKRYDEVGHSDTRLYTRAVARLAIALNDYCALKPEEIAREWIADEAFMRTCLLHRSTKATLKQHLRRCFDADFGNPKAGFDELAALVSKEVFEIPNHRARRRAERQTSM